MIFLSSVGPKFYLDKVQDGDGIPVSVFQILKMKPGCLIQWIEPLHCIIRIQRMNTWAWLDMMNTNSVGLIGDAEISEISLQCMSGLALRREASWDQKRGIDPRTWTTELIRSNPGPDPVSSTTICSVSTSFATRPLSLTPRFKYLSPGPQLATKHAITFA